MKLLKTHPVLRIVNSFVVDSPLPANITYFWNYGSLLGLTLIIQIITGIFLAMHYTPHINMAFDSVEHICRDVNYGWLLRYVHANGASMFFLMVYLHIARGIYYGSYTAPRVLLWNVGVIIFLVMIITAFLGYVLPWGGMSFWGATVITNLLSAIPWIGNDLVEFIWGGFSVDNATLNRFFSFHYLFPFIIVALVCVHLIALHEHGSNNPQGVKSHGDKIPFHPYFSYKDILGVVVYLIVFSILVFFYPNTLGEPDNYTPANPLVTPSKIVPEWYLLPFYAILRAIPDKLLGVIAMILAILILLILPYLHTANVRSNAFLPLHKKIFWLFIGVVLMLGWLGKEHPEEPYILVGQVMTALYFGYFVIVLPILGYLNNLIEEYEINK